MSARCSIDDLAAAADWLRAYESDFGVIGDNGAPDDDERAQQHLRAATWIDAEITRREDEKVVRAIARKAGCSLARARRALRQQRAAVSA